MERTWRGTWGGILTIIAGCIGIGFGATVAGFAEIIGELAEMPGLGALVGAPLIVMGIIALIGGIFALRRRAWGFALTGAILAIPCSLCLFGGGVVIGILAVIFVSMGKKEFA